MTPDQADKSDYQYWLSSPITKKLEKGLQERINDAVETISAGGFVNENSKSTVGEDANHMSGYLMGLKESLTLISDLLPRAGEETR